MADSKIDAFDALNRELERADMLLSAAEMHGMVTGVAASAAPLKASEWQGLLADLANEGRAFSASMKHLLNDLDALVREELADPELGFQLLLPDEDEPLSERLNALTAWAQSFLVGFGVNHQNLVHASDDLREAIQDMAEIARLSDDVEADEEGERAFYEVTEYVRITAIMCFSELASRQVTPDITPKTLH